MEIEAGTIFGFLGPNGAGKTTTIRLLLGLLDPTAGSAEVLGFDTRTDSEEIRTRSGALLEHNGLYERLSAEDNLEFYGRVYHLTAPERQARIRELLDPFELWERRKETVDTWSRGMKQKLAVARAMLHRPALIFLDEPTAGLDPVAAAALRDDLAALAAREGVTVFLTTHNLVEAEKLCGHVGVINEGRLIAIGRPNELRSALPRVEITGSGFTEPILATLRGQSGVAVVAANGAKLLLELRDGAPCAPIVKYLVGAGAEVEEVRKLKPSLEESFLALMKEEEQR